MDANSNESNRYSLARDRSRRVKSDKKGRFAALERLQAAKSSGKKAKYEVADLDNVYEEVEEGEYSDIVQGRQDDDWIVDDGSGYVEDGREIFDEDVSTAKDTTKNKKSNQSKKNPNIRPHNSKPSNIQAMFAAAAIKPKKPEKSASIKGDDDLGDMLAQLHQDKGTKVLPTSAKTSKQPLKAVNPFSSVPIKKVTNPKPQMKSKIVPQKQKQVIRQVALPRPTLSTALEDLGDIAADVEDDMEMQENCEPKTNVIEPDAEMGTMDLADIDFDDDDGFGQEIDNNNSKLEAKQSVESQPMVTQASLLNESESFWADDMADTELPVDVQVDSSQLPLCTNDDGEQVIRMFWIDAYEDYYKQPGIVYLFGKVWIESAHSHVSCCVAVKNIDRRLFVLPRAFKKPANSNSLSEEPVNFMDVYKEFDEKIGAKYGINKFKSKKVTKSYAFELEGIPAESDYLEVRYAATCPALPMDVKGETFSHVFGTNTSSLEIFLLERKLKGPCWIDIKMPQLASPPVSWCKIESFVNRPDYISVCAKQMSSPPLVTMALNVRILPHPKTHQNEIIGVSCLIQREFYMDKPAPKTLFQQHFCVINKPSDCIYPFDFKDVINKMGPDKKIEVTGSERALLGYVLAKIHKIDPDLIVGHDILGFDLEVLLHRIDQNKIPHWSKIGRLKRSIMPKLNLGFNTKGGAASSAVSGRLVCDVMISGKELLRCRSYDLTEMVAQILKTQRNAVDFEEVRQCFSSSQELLRLTNYTLMDAKHALSLMYELNALPLALQITNICGNVLARTLQGGRSQRNEYLLLHAFNEKNFIVPDKTFKKKEIASIDEDMNMDVSTVKKNGKRKPAYAGGLVLEPKKGFYDSFILLLDFNSLYPSIIQEFNICFTTIVRPTNRNGQEDDDDYTSLQLPDSDIPAGILPTEIRKLVQSRRQVKQLMKRPDITQEALMQYDIRQKALKLTANSMYGCLGFSFSRFYAKPLAALVTSKGREILMKTKELTENLNYEVIYGDTDSIMINTNSTDLDEVQKIGNRIKVEVNKLHRLVEIEIDGVFKSMLLLKKKKYAALTVQKIDDQIVTSRELKGLDIVRRDWCELAKTAGNYVVDQILSGQPRETIVENIHSKLCSVSETVKNGEMDLSLYQISKQLTKNPEDYPDKKSLPHVQVALRLNTKGGKKLRSGDTIFYVICKDGSNLSATQRAYHIDELAKNETLTIDTEYYLSHQVHPVVSRLCDPIEGTDAAHIAECLGLDPSEYRRQSNQSEHNEEEALLGAQLSDEEKYRDCDRFKYACKACGNLNSVDAVFSGVSTEIHCTMKHCSNKDCNVEPLHNLSYICNQLTLTIRKHIKQYYEGQLKCEDQACNASTRKLPSHLSKGHGRCQACNRGNLQEQYTDSMLYTQLCFYRHVFDFKRAKLLLTDHKEKELVKLIPGDVQKAYETLEQHVHHVIASSAYSHVNLTRLFDGMCHLFSTPA